MRTNIISYRFCFAVMLGMLLAFHNVHGVGQECVRKGNLFEDEKVPADLVIVAIEWTDKGNSGNYSIVVWNEAHRFVINKTEFASAGNMRLFLTGPETFDLFTSNYGDESIAKWEFTTDGLNPPEGEITSQSVLKTDELFLIQRTANGTYYERQNCTYLHDGTKYEGCMKCNTASDYLCTYDIQLQVEKTIPAEKSIDTMPLNNVYNTLYCNRFSETGKSLRKTTKDLIIDAEGYVESICYTYPWKYREVQIWDKAWDNGTDNDVADGCKRFSAAQIIHCGFLNGWTLFLIIMDVIFTIWLIAACVYGEMGRRIANGQTCAAPV